MLSLQSIDLNLPVDSGQAIAQVMRSLSTSYWLKSALRIALERDCVDAVADAEVLTGILQQRCREILGPSL